MGCGTPPGSASFLPHGKRQAAERLGRGRTPVCRAELPGFHRAEVGPRLLVAALGKKPFANDAGSLCGRLPKPES